MLLVSRKKKNDVNIRIRKRETERKREICFKHISTLIKNKFAQGHIKKTKKSTQLATAGQFLLHPKQPAYCLTRGVCCGQSSTRRNGTSSFELR